MWSRISSLWPLRNRDNDYLSNTQVLFARPSPRLVGSEPTFIIEATLFTKRKVSEPAPVLYLNTSSRAIADYCLLERLDDMMTSTNIGSCALHPESPKHLEVCLRMRRCGATKVFPQSWTYPEGCDIDLESYTNDVQHIFGWPPQSTQASSEEQPQAVWVLPILRKTDIRTQERVRQGGIEASLGLEDLADCLNMTEYCDKLREYGATYYENVKDCPEASALGLISPAAELELA